MSTISTLTTFVVLSAALLVGCHSGSIATLEASRDRVWQASEQTARNFAGWADSFEVVRVKEWGVPPLKSRFDEENGMIRTMLAQGIQNRSLVLDIDVSADDRVEQPSTIQVHVWQWGFLNTRKSFPDKERDIIDQIEKRVLTDSGGGE